MTTIEILRNTTYGKERVVNITLLDNKDKFEVTKTFKREFDEAVKNIIRSNQPFWISDEHREVLQTNNIELVGESKPLIFGRNGYSFSDLKINDTKIINETNKADAIMSNLKQEYWLSTERKENEDSYNKINFTFFASDYVKLLEFYFQDKIERFNAKFFSSVKEENNYVETFINNNKGHTNFFFFEIKGFGPTVKIYKYNKVDKNTTYQQIEDQGQTFYGLKKKEEISGEEWLRAFLWYTFLSAWHVFYIALLIIIIYIEEIIEIIQETLKETAESNLARKRLLNKKSKATRLANQAEVEGKIRKANRKLRKIKLEQEQEEMNFKQKEQIQKKMIKKQKDFIEDK